MGWNVKRRERYALIEQDEANPLLHRGTFHIGPRHVKHQVTEEFVEFHYVENPTFASENNCRVFAQNSHIAIEVYDYYVKLFNPDYETVSVYDAKFEVQYLFKTTPKEEWRSADGYNPSIQVIPLADGVEIKKTFDTDYGATSLEISYIIRTGAFLKHTIVFTNKTVNPQTFRVVMKLAGIVNAKVRHKDATETITAEKHIISPFMFFGEDNQNLKLTEYLWSLGVTDEETGEWTATTLKDIILNVHAQGCKVDIVIGNYVLAENENLLIDPDSDTWQVDANSDDCRRYGYLGDEGYCYFSHTDSSPYLTGRNIYQPSRHGLRFLSIGIPQGSTVTDARLVVNAKSIDPDTPIVTIDGELTADAITFDDGPDFDGRDRTVASVNWTLPAWNANDWKTSDNIASIVHEIVNQVGWVSNNNLVIFTYNGDYNIEKEIFHHDSGVGNNAPKLEVTWEEAVPLGQPYKSRVQYVKGMKSW